MPKPRPITVVRNFGGKRLAENAVPTSCVDWSKWECDPSPKFAGRKPTRGFAWGAAFPWHFDKEEKAFVVQGGATLIQSLKSVCLSRVRIYLTSIDPTSWLYPTQTLPANPKAP